MTNKVIMRLMLMINNIYDSANHVISDVLNLMVGPTPIEVKYENMPLEGIGMALILNG